MCYKCQIDISIKKERENVKYLLKIKKKQFIKINFIYFFSLFFMWLLEDFKLYMWLTFFSIGLNYSQSFAKITNRLALVPVPKDP